ncbi:phosphodiester glycosidase family protein [Aquibacillus salsiterrae]|uniref:Phosphodiester glycosidase family protein n=1 Tax=Aquibacillus salsiterrae TaxID=2950439 RepID=A0A9X4ADY3_9BACI|nr:phosphodiester glycosidase family protein [Aquibacillus salsiterrae]MDC3416107.1 phosphodiester glycosidase family protein [Aquibacillus salsiterrae]
MLHKLLRNSYFYILIIVILFSMIPSQVWAQGGSFVVSPGISYNRIETTYQDMKEQINMLSIDLNNQYAGIEIGVPDPLNSLVRPTQLAKEKTNPGHRVVGAINASFFTYNRKLPMYLLMRNDSIVNTGILGKGKDSYASEPIAFGIDAQGKAKIDRFNLDISFTHETNTYDIYSIDYPRFEQKIYLYTPNYYEQKLDTNQYGVELLIQNTSDTPFESINIGQSIQGKVLDIRKYGETRQFEIPDDGFVISAAGGTYATEFAGISVGDPISIQTSIDDTWKDGKFMLGSGPMLVNNGQVDLSMDPNSSRALEVAPRTAVAIDQDNNKVFFITVDGRSTTSKGMNLIQFANYLKSLGVDQALNLDGGGSTTMAVRTYGDENVRLINRPSDGWERAVSASLQAISYAPTGQAETMLMKPLVTGSVLKGATIALQPDTTYILDKYFNKLPVEESKFQIQLKNGVGQVVGDTYNATSTGAAAISVNYENATSLHSFQVVAQPTKLSLTSANTVYDQGEVASLSVKAIDDNGKVIRYSGDQIDWIIPDGLEMVSNGRFRVTTLEKKQVQVTAKLAGKIAALTLYLNPTNLLLEDFETTDGWETTATQSVSTISQSIGFEPIAVGDHSLKLTYDSNATSGTSVNYVNPTKPITINGNPNDIGMWVYGDGQSGWLRGKIQDANGDEYYLGFTEYNGLTWKGWKYVKAEVPTGAVSPLKLTTIYLAQSNGLLKSDGSIYLDQLEAIYTEDYQPTINTPKVYQSGPVGKTWTVEFNTRIDERTVSNQTVYVLDENGQRVKVDVSLDTTRKKILVKPTTNYVKHDFYKLVITKNISSLYGVPAKVGKEMIFQVN